MAATGLLSVGELAPDFELPDQTGDRVSLTGLLGHGALVMFFYPAAMSPGCTAQSCHFRDLGAEFAELGASLVGVSQDSVERQRQFDEANHLGYPLLADVTGEVCRKYGVARTGAPARLLPMRRSTYVIAPDRHIMTVVHSELRMDAHADRALAALRHAAS